MSNGAIQGPAITVAILVGYGVLKCSACPVQFTPSGPTHVDDGWGGQAMTEEGRKILRHFITEHGTEGDARYLADQGVI